MMLPEKADLFWTTENYHDFHNGPTADIAALDKAVFNNLKPGGIFYVEDHSAAPGAGLAATSSFTAWTKPSPRASWPPRDSGWMPKATCCTTRQTTGRAAIPKPDTLSPTASCSG